VPFEKVCVGCEITFPLDGKKGDRKYCTIECFFKYGATLPKPHQKGKAIVWQHEPRKCIQCGKEYIPTGPSHRYCSSDCKREWNLAVSATLTEKACSICKEVKPIDQFTWIEDKGIYRSDCKTCVGARSKAAHKEFREQNPLTSNRRSYLGFEEIARVCEWCKKEYYPTFYDQRFCGRNCSGASNIDRSEIVCKQCGKDFKKTGNAHEFCSTSCSKDWNFALDMTDKSKVCTKCKEDKPMSAYAQNPKTGYFQAECVACMNKARDARRDANPDTYKHSSRKTHIKKLGLTIKQFDILMEKQDGKCWICGNEETRPGRRLSIDHCHADGYIRGLLCGNCNTGLGLFKDRTDLLARAVDYLEIHREINNFLMKGEPLCP
jgi:hypothetical protein